MFTVFKKEIKTFLGSLIGYLAILVFLLAGSLFLWVFPGSYNIPDNGYATLNGFFTLAPWLYLFLIPAITMRSFAEEKRQGTIEILFTRPVSDFSLVVAKFMAGVVLVALSLLPTLIWFFSVYKLGNPVGTIDVGGTWGAFLGLFFLASIYVAIGIFSSSVTENQLVAFILAMSGSFVFFQGFEFVASLNLPYSVELLFSWLSINSHYLSVSRGVIDLRDITYFLGMTFLFLQISSLILRKEKIKSVKTIIKSGGVIIALAIVFIVSSNFLVRIDLTAEKRYSLSPISKKIAANLEYITEIELYLDGELEPGLRKIQSEVLEKIAVLNAYSKKPVRVRLFDPYRLNTNKKQNEFMQELVQKGVVPTSFRHKTNKGISEKLIFPGAIIRYNGKETAVNLLKNNPQFSYETNFNHSVESVEFELINALQKLTREKKNTLAFLEGQGEANEYEVREISLLLENNFNLERLTVEKLRTNSDQVDILIIADPRKPFSEKEKIIIDQYIMQGGKVVWFIDPVQVSLDSLANGHQTFSFPADYNLTDQLFRYGFRLNTELLQDVDCIRIAVNTAPPGNPSKYTIHPSYYFPHLTPNDNHAASRNLNRVKSEFVSSVDTVSGDSRVKKSVILNTSPNARSVMAPASVSLQNINNPPARELFNKSNIPVGVIAEGIFTSVYKNRMIENFGFNPVEFIPESVPTKMVVIADGGIITNQVNYATQPPQTEELGYDRVMRQTFGNKEFILNILAYLNDEEGIMQLRNRTLKLRLLDKVKIREEELFWQWLNMLVPVLLIAIFGAAYNLVRSYRYKR